MRECFTKKEENTLPYLDNLMEMRKGSVLVEATEGLEKVVEAVRAKGSITLTIHVDVSEAE